MPWCQGVSSTKTNCPGPDILDTPLGHTKYYTLLWQSYTIHRLLLRLKTISIATPTEIIRCLGVWIFKQENGSIKEDEIVDQKYWNLPIEFLEVAPSAPSPLEEAGLASRHFWYLWKIKLTIYRNDIIALLTSVCTQPRWSYTRAPLLARSGIRGIWMCSENNGVDMTFNWIYKHKIFTTAYFQRFGKHQF